MSETIGPLDLIRDIEADAAKLDAFVEYHLEDHPEDLGALRAQVEDLASIHPWLNQEVSMDGVCLAVSVDDEQLTPYALPADRETSKVRGLYHGMSIRHVYDAEADEQKYKILHMINIDDSGLVVDQFGNVHQPIFIIMSACIKVRVNRYCLSTRTAWTILKMTRLL